jgi:membrane-bound lytic murein transglycosylase B
VAFWGRHEDILADAEARFGVEPEYVVAIIGVETYYGRRTGSFPVLDTLTTLGFDYPPRSRFFSSELEHYLLLTREESLDPLRLKGSYAGAMGKGQFISSSYRAYAVDFDGDGQRDLWGSTRDAVGSVANYLARHGWTHRAPVTVPASARGEAYLDLLDAGLKPSLDAAALRAAGVSPAPGDAPVALVALEAEAGTELWLGHNNFYVITRYNRSPLYAMAVHQLAQAIREAHLGAQAAAR